MPQGVKRPRDDDDAAVHGRTAVERAAVVVGFLVGASKEVLERTDAEGLRCDVLCAAYGCNVEEPFRLKNWTGRGPLVACHGPRVEIGESTELPSSECMQCLHVRHGLTGQMNGFLL